MSVNFRLEIPTDIPAIHALHRQVFGSEAEATLVDRLREDGAHVFSLVAIKNGQRIGHALFSRLHAPMEALALAPVAVSPDWQGKKIGSQLIRHGHRLAEEQRWDAAFVLGDPAYYTRFCYDVEAARGFACPYAGEYFMIKTFRTPQPVSGSIIYPRAFGEIT